MQTIGKYQHQHQHPSQSIDWLSLRLHCRSDAFRLKMRHNTRSEFERVRTQARHFGAKSYNCQYGANIMPKTTILNNGNAFSQQWEFGKVVYGCPPAPRGMA